ncbi:plasmid mobilization relaxosome protein MobC [Maribellus comscasis]|uniref:Plasmid mobilization relaxosome protein MobC n=1 Tax=Maribellus comscasis TaxID=2681766 RepID=A0A6I6K2S3_9BACT|nr:plasmid mobilization relaxosome protein MobC [Maribellus comscasis]
MRPKLPDNEKRTIVVKFLMTKEERLRLDSLVKRGKFGCTSDFLRYKIFNSSVRKIISLDEEANAQLKKLDYEINKIGVNLNQLSKRMNSFAGYNIGDNDRQLLKQAFEMMTRCLAFLQKYLR